MVLWILPLLVHSWEESKNNKEEFRHSRYGDKSKDFTGGQLHHRMREKKDDNEEGGKIKTRNAAKIAVIDGRRGTKGITREVAKGGTILFQEVIHQTVILLQGSDIVRQGGNIMSVRTDVMTAENEIEIMMAGMLRVNNTMGLVIDG